VLFWIDATVKPYLANHKSNVTNYDVLVIHKEQLFRILTLTKKSDVNIEESVM